MRHAEPKSDIMPDFDNVRTNYTLETHKEIVMKIDENLIIAIVDCETTGLDPEIDRIVEIAVVSVSLKDGPVVFMSELFNPRIPIPAAASAIHHIIDEDVAGRSEFSVEGWKERRCAEVFAAHNAEFDLSFLKITHPTICTMRLAQQT